jgi:hypothetical protein
VSIWVNRDGTRLAHEGGVPLAAAEAVKERLARGEEIRTTRARRGPCGVSVVLAVVILGLSAILPILLVIEPWLLWSNCGQ